MSRDGHTSLGFVAAELSLISAVPKTTGTGDRAWFLFGGRPKNAFGTAKSFWALCARQLSEMFYHY